MAGKQLAQPAKALVLVQIGPGVPEGTRHVLDVDRVDPGRRLVAEGTESLEIPLERHQIEGRTADEIAGDLTAAFARYCGSARAA